MKMNKSKIAVALVLAGVSVGVAQTASAAILADGNYNININQNPGTSTTVPGSDGPTGSWNSTFTFGGSPPTFLSSGMFDVGPTTVAGRTVGVLDGYAGKIGITVTGNTYTVNSFQVDPIFSTIFGTMAQYANSSASMSGTIDQTTGAMTFTPTGRLAAPSAFPSLVDKPWNIDDITVPGTTAWNMFTTGVATGFDPISPPTTVTGRALVASGIGANGVLVSAGRFGSTWGSISGLGYYETWNISVTPVPVPAAAWLLGTGLIGLIGLGRRSRVDPLVV